MLKVISFHYEGYKTLKNKRQLVNSPEWEMIPGMIFKCSEAGKRKTNKQTEKTCGNLKSCLKSMQNHILAKYRIISFPDLLWTKPKARSVKVRKFVFLDWRPHLTPVQSPL